MTQIPNRHNEPLQSFQNMEITCMEINKQECRICLEQMPQNPPTFCACRGNHQYMHQKCLIAWLDRRLTETQIKNEQIVCQLCTGTIKLIVRLECETRNPLSVCHSQLCEKSCCSSDIVALLVIFIFSVSLMVLLIVLYNANRNELGYLLYVVYIFAAICLACILFFMFKFVVKCKRRFNGVQANRVGNGKIGAY